MAAKQRDLLKCRTKEEVREFAKKNKLPTKSAGSEIQVGGWTCVFVGEKFSYIK